MCPFACGTRTAAQMLFKYKNQSCYSCSSDGRMKGVCNEKDGPYEPLKSVKRNVPLGKLVVEKNWRSIVLAARATDPMHFWRAGRRRVLTCRDYDCCCWLRVESAASSCMHLPCTCRCSLLPGRSDMI